MRGVNDTSRSDERVTITHSASGGDYDGVSGTVTVNVGDTDSDDRVWIVPVPNAVVVLPDVETTITSLDGNATLTFPVDSRSAGFQVSMDASLDNCTTNNPPEGTVHACVSVEIFDAAGNREESAALDEAATLEFRLGPERVEELSGQETLREADEEGRLLLMTREGPDDVWREVQFVLFLTEEGGALLTISVREFSEFAIVIASTPEPVVPEPTPEPTVTPEPTPEPTATTGVTPTATPVPGVTVTPSATPVPTPEPTATTGVTPTATPVPGVIVTPSATPVPTPEPTATTGVTPTATPVPGVTVTPSATPVPTEIPTQATPTATSLAPTPTPEPTVTAVPGSSAEDGGANVGLIVLIVVLVTAAVAGGGALVVVRRRRTS